VRRRRAQVERALLLHRQAASSADLVGQSLSGYAPDKAPVAEYAEQHRLASELRALAAELAPGWLGASLDALPRGAPLGDTTRSAVGEPTFVRIGTAQPLDDARFPVVIPLLRTGHLATDADARDPRVAGMMRSVLLRLLASSRPGSLTIKAVDPTNRLFNAFGLTPAPVTDRAGLRAALADAEQWVRDASRSDTNRTRDLILIISSFPELTEPDDLLRVAALAQNGPGAGVHLIVAGWPPPPVTPETTQQPLANATNVSMRNPHVVVSDPPGGRFGITSGALAAPVYLDPDPSNELIKRTAVEVLAQARANSAQNLTALLPTSQWQDSSAHGMVTTVGWAYHAGHDAPVTLRFNDLSPHWLIGGRAGAGKTAFLTNLLFGLCSRYSPDELAIYLVDLAEGISFAEFTASKRDPAYLPHARAIGIEVDRSYALALLRELDRELHARAMAMRDEGAAKFTELRRARTVPRIVAFINEFAGLIDDEPEAAELLESVLRRGRGFGVHLILASSDAPAESHDAILGQFPVRIALPGGGHVLDPRNHAAAGLAVGEAVINTAGGLGGPTGASRAHERVVEFPDPHAEEAALARIRRALWRARSGDYTAPATFIGYAEQHLDDDPAFLALSPDAPRKRILVGRVVEPMLGTAAFTLDGTPGRHLGVVGVRDGAADVLTAAVRSVAAQHRPGTVEFTLVPLVAAADPAVAALTAQLTALGHRAVVGTGGDVSSDRPDHSYLVVFGVDALAEHGDLSRLVADGPTRGAYLFGWWRSVRRFVTDTADTVACLVALNVAAPDLQLLHLPNQPRRPRHPNRALLHDRHNLTIAVIVPFTEGDR
jgi:hypothetical protein